MAGLWVLIVEIYTKSSTVVYKKSSIPGHDNIASTINNIVETQMENSFLFQSKEINTFFSSLIFLTLLSWGDCFRDAVFFL